MPAVARQPAPPASARAASHCRKTWKDTSCAWLRRSRRRPRRAGPAARPASAASPSRRGWRGSDARAAPRTARGRRARGRRRAGRQGTPPPARPAREMRGDEARMQRPQQRHAQRHGGGVVHLRLRLGGGKRGIETERRREVRLPRHLRQAVRVGEPAIQARAARRANRGCSAAGRPRTARGWGSGPAHPRPSPPPPGPARARRRNGRARPIPPRATHRPAPPAPRGGHRRAAPGSTCPARW